MKKNARFEPEADGNGKVHCPADAKAMKRVNTRPRTNTMAEALRVHGFKISFGG